jgi:hypothetical protein
MAHDSGFHYTHHMVKQFLAAYTDAKNGQRGALDILWPRLVDQHNGPRLEETLFRGEDRQVVRAWTLMRVRRGTRKEGRGKRGYRTNLPTYPCMRTCDVWPPVYSGVCGVGGEGGWGGGTEENTCYVSTSVSLRLCLYFCLSHSHHSLYPFLRMQEETPVASALRPDEAVVHKSVSKKMKGGATGENRGNGEHTPRKGHSVMNVMGVT